MMEKGDIVGILEKWNFWKKDRDTGVERQITGKIYNALEYNKIITITGVRRCGKSYILRQLVRNIIENGAANESTLIVNFEEPMFEETDLKMLLRIYESYMEIINTGEKPDMFLDEIQEVDRWEKFVRSLNEKKEANIVITGSSSKLMSAELATILTGRQLTFEIFPLSFGEFLVFKKLKIRSTKDVYLNAAKIKKYVWEYIEHGGFPEIVLIEDKEIKSKIVLEYYNTILNRDIIQRYNIRSTEKIKKLAKYYVSNMSSLITYRKLEEFLKIPAETISRFSEHLVTAKLVFFVDRFSFSPKEQERSPRKVYCIDNGFFASIGFRFMENRGKLIENMVAVELKRRQASNPALEIYYWQDYQQREVDFVVKEGKRIGQLLQVCYNPGEFKTKERELKALVKGAEELKCDDLIVITWDYEAEEKFKDKKVRFLPLWKWLLS